MKNKHLKELIDTYNITLDRNGYGKSLLQHDLTYCFKCGRRCEKLDRHEVFGSENRAKSKALGLYVMLCHDTCHLNGVHVDATYRRRLRAKAQEAAMKEYGWTTKRFIDEMGMNYID